jgi:hypothetical protein
MTGVTYVIWVMTGVVDFLKKDRIRPPSILTQEAKWSSLKTHAEGYNVANKFRGGGGEAVDIKAVCRRLAVRRARGLHGMACVPNASALTHAQPKFALGMGQRERVDFFSSFASSC